MNQIYEHWFDAHLAWRANPDCHPLPPKPDGYDLWLQGEDPLRLALTKPICCHGGGLVPDTWTPSALPVTPAGELMTQPTLL